MDFNEERHEYSDNGKVIPSVTQIIYGSSSKPWFNKASSDRGHLAHELCAAYARDPSDKYLEEPYVDAFVLWCSLRNPNWKAIEEMIEGKVDGYRYAGRFDGLAIIDGLLTLVDYKTGVRAKSHIAQLAAYSLVTKPAKCLLLYLHNDGTYNEQWISSNELVQGIRDFRIKTGEWYANNN